MARIYNPVGPSDNKAVHPGKEKKPGKPSGVAPGKGEGKSAPSVPGSGDNAQEQPENAG